MPIFLETKVSYRCPRPEQFRLGQKVLLSWDVNCGMDHQTTLNSHRMFPFSKSTSENGWAKNATVDYARHL